MLFPKILLGFVSLTSSSTIDYLTEEKDARNREIPVLHDFRTDFDVSSGLVYSVIRKILYQRHLTPFNSIFLSMSSVSKILKAYERLDKVADKYDELFDGLFEELAPVNAKKLVFPVIGNYWNRNTAEFSKELTKHPSNPSTGTVEKRKRNFNKEEKSEIKSRNEFSRQIQLAIHENGNISESIIRSYLDSIVSILEQTENIWIETSKKIGNKETEYTKGNYAEKYKLIKDNPTRITLLHSWIFHISSQKLIVEYQAAVKQECINGVQCFVSSHKIDHFDILDKFIDAQVRMSLKSLCETFAEDLPRPISLQIGKMKAIFHEFYSLKTVNGLKKDIKELGTMYNTWYAHLHLIRIERKAYKYGILLRKEMLKVFNEYAEQIKKSLAVSVVKFGLASLPTTFFFDMLKELKFEFNKYEEGIKSEIQKLETAELNEDTYPIIDKVWVDISLLERQIEFCRAEFLACVEHFQQNMSSEIHELAQQLVLCFSNNENNLLAPFDSTNETFEEYVNRTLPRIKQAIKKIRKEYISQKSSTLISEDQVIPDIIPEDSKTKLVDITRNFLKEYLDYPLLCGLDQNNQNSGPSLVSKNEILVGTFNAEWLFPFPDSVNEDGVGSYIWGSERAAARHFSDIVEVIESINADILLLEEVQDCRVLSAIVDALKQKGITDYSAYLVPTNDVTLGHHLGILSRYKPTEVSFAENTISKNIFARFHFINENGEEAKIAIMGVHMIAGENEGKRNMQALSIASFLENNLQQDERLLIMGDMNDYDPRVRGHGPHSSCLEILSHSRNVLINPLNRIRGKNLRTQSQRGIVDHILGEKELNIVQPKIHSELVWSKKGSLSDHAPVTVEIRPFGVSADCIQSIDENY